MVIILSLGLSDSLITGFYTRPNPRSWSQFWDF